MPDDLVAPHLRIGLFRFTLAPVQPLEVPAINKDSGSTIYIITCPTEHGNYDPRDGRTFVVRPPTVPMGAPFIEPTIFSSIFSSLSSGYIRAALRFVRALKALSCQLADLAGTHDHFGTATDAAFLSGAGKAGCNSLR
jgi:hypothetical protein